LFGVNPAQQKGDERRPGTGKRCGLGRTETPGGRRRQTKKKTPVGLER